MPEMLGRWKSKVEEKARLLLEKIDTVIVALWLGFHSIWNSPTLLSSTASFKIQHGHTQVRSWDSENV